MVGFCDLGTLGKWHVRPRNLDEYRTLFQLGKLPPGEVERGKLDRNSYMMTMFMIAASDINKSGSGTSETRSGRARDIVSDARDCKHVRNFDRDSVRSWGKYW